ncbi:MAG: hypothetical protein ACYDCK_10620 [Thermoplasmatota archaeon]
MSVEISLPDDVGTALDALVSAGQFRTRDDAAVALIRRGLRGGTPARPGGPQPPPVPPGRHEPMDDAPIQPEPTDTNWM